MSQSSAHPQGIAESDLLMERKSRFAELARLIPHTGSYDLLLDHEIEAGLFKALQLQTCIYISACLVTGGRVLSAEEIVERLSDRRVSLPNKTPNGLLLAKADMTLEFNLLHKCFARIMSGLGFDHLTDVWSLPMNVRVVSGQADPAILNRPYASSKAHSDTWAGEPADSVLLNVPILGDIGRTSLEWLEPPPALGESHLKTLSDFNDGEAIVRQSSKIDLTPKLGHIYFSDCALLHRTVRVNGGGCRVSIDLRIRMKTTPSYKAYVERLRGPSTLGSHYVPFQLWQRVGTETLMVFEETMEECRNKYRTPQASYGTGAPFKMLELNTDRAEVA